MSQQAVVQAQQKTAEASSTKGSILQRAAVIPAITPVHSAILQRCSGGVECEACRQRRLERASVLQRAAVSASPVNENGVPPVVHDVLNSPGQPLDAGTRAFMEPRFGHDFSQVRVHTDARAAESVRAVNALAYTVGRDVVFGVGQYKPDSMEGKRLLAHELTHVVQQSSRTSQIPTEIDRGLADPFEQVANNVAGYIMGFRQPSSDLHGIPDATHRYAMPALSHSHYMIQRQKNMSVAQETQAIPASNPERQARLEQLLNEINTQTAENLSLRSELDALSPASSEERTGLETEINSRRSALISLLEQRIALLDEEIAALKAGVGPNLVSSPEHPEAEIFGSELIRREGERRQHAQQLRPLKRWQMQNDIQLINEQIAEVDRELASLPPESTPTTDNLFLRRAELERQKKEMAVALTSTATEYKQFDTRWGAIRYGQSADCTNIKAAGCGPTSLAILLNYLYQEDPEMLAASGQMEIVTPEETASFAATHGRVCNSGTAGDVMVTQVNTGWPGFSGRRIALTDAVTQLRSGNLVIFLCKNCTGKNRSGGDKHYGGHFMVLNGVNDDGTVFNVLDPGASEAKDIETISHQELKDHTNGFWIVERK
jgi:hypothetical protein